jgi:hypothetical protein
MISLHIWWISIVAKKKYEYEMNLNVSENLLICIFKVIVF